MVHASVRAPNLRKGPPPTGLRPTEGLGVLVSEHTFIRRTASAFKLLHTTFEKSYRRWIAYEAKIARKATPTQSEIDAAFMFHRAIVPARQDGEIWLFRNPNRSVDAFCDLRNEWLAARLALGVRLGEVRLTFSFKGANVDAPVVPRFYDATWQYLAKWHWSGKTKPLPGTPTSFRGLEEVIASPPMLRDLNQPVLATTYRVP